MIHALSRAAARSAMLAGFAALAGFIVILPATAQQPTDEQRAAIRSSCRADYEANCASVPPGGMASLQCLQKNMGKLSGSCQQAVKAVEAAPTAEPGSEPKPDKAESAPAAPKAEKMESAPGAPKAPSPAAPAASAPAKAAASPPARKPTGAQVAVIRSSCRADYPQVCAGVPTGGAAALTCLEKKRAKLSANCQRAVSAASGAAPAPAAETAKPAPAATAVEPPPPSAPPPVLALRPLRLREELLVLRSACGSDVRSLCGEVAPGGGRIAQCLAGQAASLSPACRDVLAQFAVR